MKSTRILAAATFLVLSAEMAAAIEDPNIERGFKADKVYDFSSIDAVNLFNLGLLVTIPIGASYPVGDGLSYGLSLVYNSSVWDYYSQDVNGVPLMHVEPGRQFNAGIGWTLSLGRLLRDHDPENPTGNFFYESPDGGRHSFRNTLHVGESSNPSYAYTRDGSYLRLRKLSDFEYEVESPDGTVRNFKRPTVTDPFQLESIRDRFSNTVTIDYPTATPTIRRRLIG